jgi:hypothetical protein
MHLPKRYLFCSSLSWFILSFLFPLMVHTYLFFTSLLDTHSGTDLNTAQSLIAWKGVKPKYEMTERQVLCKTEQRRAKEEKEMRGGYKSIRES